MVLPSRTASVVCLTVLEHMSHMYWECTAAYSRSAGVYAVQRFRNYAMCVRDDARDGIPSLCVPLSCELFLGTRIGSGRTRQPGQALHVMVLSPTSRDCSPERQEERDRADEGEVTYAEIFWSCYQVKQSAMNNYAWLTIQSRHAIEDFSDRAPGHGTL